MKKQDLLRLIVSLSLLASFVLASIFLFPFAEKVLHTYSIDYYNYRPWTPVVSEVDTSSMNPAFGVPVILYHGVTYKEDGTNTSLHNFIEQMEMLKKNGYTTISVAEYDAYLHDKFELPAKPIILTFDDGRKDSFYTTDDILKDLGFKATVFVASVMIEEENSFYLSWEQLKEMKDSGRWEIEAHGHQSHENIRISPDAEDEMGRFLTSRIYLVNEGRIETVEEFETRVENDYLQNISLLKEKLGVDARYFAVPRGDYGQRPISNYYDGFTFNEELAKKYFSITFLEMSTDSITRQFSNPIYNFKSDDPQKTRRIEVKNLSASELKNLLEKEKPTLPELNANTKTFPQLVYDKNHSVGVFTPSSLGMQIVAEKPNSNGQYIVGEQYWHNYRVSAVMERVTGQSMTLMFNYKDSKNYMLFGMSGNSYFLRSVVNGNIQNTQIPVKSGRSLGAPQRFMVEAKDGFVTASVDGNNILYSKIPVPVKNGRVGVRVWDKEVPASGIIHSLVIESI